VPGFRRGVAEHVPRLVIGAGEDFELVKGGGSAFKPTEVDPGRGREPVQPYGMAGKGDAPSPDPQLTFAPSEALPTPVLENTPSYLPFYIMSFGNLSMF